MKAIQEIIDYMEATSEESWCVDVVRVFDGKANCFFGHLFAMGKDDKEGNHLWETFEEAWATTYMIYPINDGKNEFYQQPTPKQRVIAYLKDLRDGKVETTYQCMERCHREIIESELLQKQHIDCKI
jgi:hypothetical protein